MPISIGLVRLMGTVGEALAETDPRGKGFPSEELFFAAWSDDVQRIAHKVHGRYPDWDEETWVRELLAPAEPTEPFVLPPGVPSPLADR